AKPVLTPAAHSRHTLAENGKLFIQLLQAGLLHAGQIFTNVVELHR
ncbi:MAG: hypothetical protein K0S91_2518, partial [Nitrososphaeraceae archaeon]|nr:hypothetical protein [Nitrososphaeraceae archaeon]